MGLIDIATQRPYRRGVTGAVTVERLMRLGLTQYEARAYVAMVRRDGSTPAEIAKLAGVPRPRIYDVMDSLVAKGLATDRPGRTAKFVAAPPGEAVQQLLGTYRDRLEMLEADARTVQDELEPAYREGAMHSDPLDYVELLRSSEAVAKRFNELQLSVRNEMLVFAKMPAAVSVQDNDAGLDVARRSELRTIYEFALLDDPDNRRAVKRFLDAGEQARFVEHVPMKLGIIDGRTVLMAMSDPVAGATDLTTLVIENVELASCLKLAFEDVWRTGVGFTTACRKRGVSRPADPWRGP